MGHSPTSRLPLHSLNLFANINFQSLDHWPLEAGSKAAIVMAFYFHESTWHLLFIRRALHLTSHRGQIGFPGGLSEVGESPASTGLREFEEEMGISSKDLQLLGCLDPVFSVGGVSVVPVIAFSDKWPVFSPSTDEVDSFFLIDIAQLKTYRRFQFNLFGEWRESGLFTTKSINIWGLSAQILKNAGFPEILGLMNEAID